MFRQNAYELDFSPEDGQSVRVYGSVSLYVKDGQYQLYVTNMEREGEGELFRRFMLMKTRLDARGYFDKSHKKPIPRLPKCVGRGHIAYGSCGAGYNQYNAPPL